jgi:hypothetical protein
MDSSAAELLLRLRPRTNTVQNPRHLFKKKMYLMHYCEFRCSFFKKNKQQQYAYRTAAAGTSLLTKSIVKQRISSSKHFSARRNEEIFVLFAQFFKRR